MTSRHSSLTAMGNLLAGFGPCLKRARSSESKAPEKKFLTSHDGTTATQCGASSWTAEAVSALRGRNGDTWMFMVVTDRIPLALALDYLSRVYLGDHEFA